MTDFRERYKRVGYGREDVDVNRALRSQRRDEDRRQMRSEHFSLLRQLDQSQEDEPSSQEQREDTSQAPETELDVIVKNRLLQLEKWKEERNRKRIQEKKKAKPVFKVGVVHHRVYSPPLTKEPVPVPPSKLCRTKEIPTEEPPKRVTRATQKRLAAKAVTTQMKNKNLKSKKKDNIQFENKKDLHKIPLAPVDHQFKAPLGVMAIPMFGRQALEATKENMQFEFITSDKQCLNSDISRNNFFNSSENSLPMGNHSIILSKSSQRRSNVNESNIWSSKSSVNKDENDSSHNSSLEAVSLKVSSSDQEMMDDQENINSNNKVDSSFPNSIKSPETKRRSSKMFTLPTEFESTSKGNVTARNKQTIIDQENTDFSSKNESFSMNSSIFNESRSKRRSSKMFKPTIESNSNNEPKLVYAEDEEIIADENRNESNNESATFSRESSILNRSKSNRRSSRMVKATVELKSTNEPTLIITEHEELISDENRTEPNNGNASLSMNSNISNRSKSTRRSSRMVKLTVDSNSTNNPKMNITEDQEMITDENQAESNNGNVTFAMDSSVLNHSKSKRRSSRVDKATEESNFAIDPKVIVMEYEEMDTEESYTVSNNQNDSFSMNSSISNQFKSKRRSSKVDKATVESKSTNKPKSSIMENQEIVIDENQAESNNQNASFSLDSSISNQSTSKRRSSRIFKPQLKMNSPEKSKIDTTVDEGRMDVEDDTNDNNANKFTDNSVMMGGKKKSRSSRRSTKMLPNELTNSEKLVGDNSFAFKDQDISEQNSSYKKAKLSISSSMPISNEEKSINGKTSRISGKVSSLFKEAAKEPDDQMLETKESSINSMILSSSNGNRIRTPGRRKSARFVVDASKPDTNVQEQSVTNFSPDSSKAKKSPKQISFTEAAKTKSPHPLINFSLQDQESLSKSRSSDIPIRKIPKKQGNSSLNNTYTENVTPDKPPAFFSPFIVTSRGKSSVRKEVQRRRFSHASPDEIPTKDTVMKTLNISVEEEERTAQYYKYILNQEIERLNELCDKWNAIKEDKSIPEDIYYEILAAIGQTTLLINKKFQRFHSLVLDCETGKGEMLVTCKDLQGFWEMMYMEIKDCDNRFNKLEDKKSNGWIDDEDSDDIKEKLPKKVVTKKPAVKKKPVTSKSSSLRAHIMAARKKKMNSKESEDDIEIAVPVHKNTRLQEVEKQLKSTDSPARTTRRTSTPKSANKWHSLLKKVQLSQTRKSPISPLIVMKLSQMCKTPEVHLDDSIVYINSDRTPAKGILKTNKDESTNTMAKSTSKVFFKEQPTEYQEIKCNDEANRDEDYVDSDKNSDTKEPIERRLNFEDDSFNSSNMEDAEEKNGTLSNTASQTVSLSPFNNSVKSNLIIPKIIVHEASPMISMSPLSLGEKSSALKKSTTKLKKQISFKEDINEGYTRRLRSSKFAVPLTPTTKKLKKPDNEADEEYSMEVDDSEKEINNSLPIPQESQKKELYLNSEGIICERTLPEEKSTPRNQRLKRSNSEASQKMKSNRTIDLDAINESPVTPRLRRNTRVLEMETSNQATPISGRLSKSKKPSLTPRIMRQSSKISDADVTSEENSNTVIEEAITPKTRKRTKAVSMMISNADLSENVNEPATPTLRRTRSKSINIPKNTDINKSIKS